MRDDDLDRSAASDGQPTAAEARSAGAEVGCRHERSAQFDRIPDVRDGLTRVERIILWQLGEAQKERGGRDVPTAMLYGRVVEHVSISVEELQRALMRLTGRGL
jgi:hypothetical protein